MALQTGTHGPISSAAHQPFDVIVVGAGPGGEDSTSALTAAGFSVALVEQELVGGECFNWACVPSKAMLRAGHALHAAQRVPGATPEQGWTIDAGAVLSHRDEIVSHHDDTSEIDAITNAGATFFRGKGRVVAERQVTVDTVNGERTLTARHGVIIATGSVPYVPDILGLRGARPWTNREATSAHAVPASLVILGAGPVALELAQAWKALGTEKVTVISRRSTLLPEFEPFVGPAIQEELERAGVVVEFDVDIRQVARTQSDGVEVEIAGGRVIAGEQILVATGKRPTSSGLGLEDWGVVGGEFIEVDDRMRVGGHEWLYAVGDVNGRALMTHQASYHARIASATIIARAKGVDSDFRDEVDGRAVPQVIFTDPQVASVGLTLAQAQTRGLNARRVDADFGAVLGAKLHADGYTGHASITVDDDTETIVGATFVGQDVADLLHSATVAVAARIPRSQLRHAIAPFPTISEIWLELLVGW